MAKKGRGILQLVIFLVKIPSIVVVFHARTYPTESHLLLVRAPAAFAYDQSMARGRKLDAAKVLFFLMYVFLGPSRLAFAVFHTFPVFSS